MLHGQGRVSRAIGFTGTAEVRAALGLAWGDPGIPNSCFSDFQARLLKYDPECEAFNQMLLSQGLIKKREALIVDASHMEANAAAHNPRVLIRKATQAILRQVRKERRHLYDDLAKAIDLTPETKFSSGPEYFLLPEAERNERFSKAVTEARTVIEKLERKKVSPAIRSQVELLKVILDERSTDEDEPIDPDDAPPDRVTSHRDPDARWGAKGKDKYFHGYKRTILTTKDHGFIANVDVVAGNATDSTPFEAMLEDSQEVFGLEPEKVIGDAAYGSLANHRKLKVMGIQMVASLKPAPNPKGRFSRNRFSYDADKKSLSCPGGQTTREAYPSADGEGLTYRFAAHQCGPCKHRDECTRGDFRSVKVGETVKDMDAAIAYGKTDDYKADMKARPVIEGKHSELVRYHGGRRTPYWTL